MDLTLVQVRLKERMNAVIPLLVPLFVSAFKRAEDLAIAMEVRGYRGGEGRTRYRQLKWDWRDTFGHCFACSSSCCSLSYFEVIGGSMKMRTIKSNY